MKSIRAWALLVGLLFATMLLVNSAAQAAPLVIGSKQSIQLPDPYFYGDIDAIAVDGDHMIVQASTEAGAALLGYDLGPGGFWSYTESIAYTPDPQGHGLAIRGDIAVSDFNGLQIFERPFGGRWEQANFSDALSLGPFRGAFAIDGDNILATTATCGVATIRRRELLSWEATGALPGASSPQCTNRWYDADGDRALAANAASTNPQVDTIRLYQRGASGSWAAGATLSAPSGVSLFDSDVQLRGARATGIAEPANGGDVVWGQSGGNWPVRGRLQSADAFESRNGDSLRMVRISGELFLQEGSIADGTGRASGAIRVFREVGGAYVHVATLPNGDLLPFLGPMAVSGRHVFVTSDSSANSGHIRRAYYYVLPESLPVPTPATLQNFEDGNANAWQTAGGQYSVAWKGKTRVYRQASVAGATGSVLTTFDQPNQVIEAEITPTAFAAANRWVGVMTRQTDWQNYYYVNLRQPHAVEFKRVLNGVTTRLGYWTGSAPAIVAGQVYRVRLESIGGSHRVLVDGRLMGSVSDNTLPSGRPGIVMYQASADYDNVLVAPGNPATLRDALFAHYPGQNDDELWSQWNAPNWVFGIDRGRFTQTSLAGNERNLTGVPTRDQRVSSQVRPTEFAPVTASQDPWAGLIVRYVDDSNFYYVSLRASNLVSLRKRVNGNIVGLDSVPLVVTPDDGHSVRLEAIGDWLRVFVDGNLLIERKDTSHPTGTYGLATYKTAAIFTNFVADEP